jgi:hypothetical protein
MLENFLLPYYLVLNKFLISKYFEIKYEIFIIIVYILSLKKLYKYMKMMYLK